MNHLMLRVDAYPPSSQQTGRGPRGRTFQSKPHQRFMKQPVTVISQSGEWPSSEGVSVLVEMWMQTPKTWRKAEREAALYKPIVKRKPDLDNVTKTLLDLVAPHAVGDDDAIHTIRTMRRWGTESYCVATFFEGTQEGAL